MTPLTIDIVSSDAGLYALAPSWGKLWRRADAMPFQSPAWNIAWWSQFGTGHPVVACAYMGPDLIGVLPLYILQDGEGPKLLPIGIGLTDYFDALLAPGAPDDIACQMLTRILEGEETSRIRICDLIDVPPHSSLLGVSAPTGWKGQWTKTTPCPVLTIRPGSKSAVDALPPRQRRKLRMNRHRADRAGGWQLLWADRKTLTPMLELLLGWSGTRWGAIGTEAVNFHQAAAGALLQAGLLWFGVLQIAEQPAACCYAIASGKDKLLFYMIGFDPKLAVCSPGTLLLGAILDAAIAEERCEVHFLRGGEAYKYVWGATDRYNVACRMVRL